MTMLKQRQLMIIRAMNDKNHPMQPISEEKFKFLGDTFGWDQLADDINYLIKIGLVNHDAMYFDIEGGYGFDPDAMSLTATGIDYANINTIDNETDSITIEIHKNILGQVETVINETNLSDAEKKNLLRLIKEHGIESIVGQCIDAVFSNAGLATPILSEVAKKGL
ncbi:hypothetical protein [Xenorhabdus szentirmaii]|uniref:DUF2513 domain-containing protein n=1 Tax=Xenorhabdus szentirmaii DSM 16338 TaxID=1427518 RepID=W1IR35_9GAMM|nr:hypothetical protein [Xenorhabdus szentirmaii]PHM32299.1 hypothetical protein Xsze_03035 [Xenorhabdus szentirmaii DSM 16338]PHM41402.1 hypothetical protein Xszus_01089 [Xenorhabdus szentirmaii]CDL80922.1 hypothetical protein XSR1_10352 [Xenorhabdus szentirmaii DSM 16338]